jgi:hypothetical protein
MSVLASHRRLAPEDDVAPRRRRPPGVYAPLVHNALGSMSNICQTNGAESADFGLDDGAPKHCESRAGMGIRGITPYQANDPNRAHNPKVAGSNPAPAIGKDLHSRSFLCLSFG